VQKQWKRTVLALGAVVLTGSLVQAGPAFAGAAAPAPRAVVDAFVPPTEPDGPKTTFLKLKLPPASYKHGVLSYKRGKSFQVAMVLSRKCASGGVFKIFRGSKELGHKITMKDIAKVKLSLTFKRGHFPIYAIFTPNNPRECLGSQSARVEVRPA
jgi:hypothetical protein